MVNFQIIKASSGLRTNEQILEFMACYPEGVTLTEISRGLNRPVSMVSICLKELINRKKVKLTKIKQQRIYHNIYHNLETKVNFS